ncbi:MAG: hypothetical protein JGK17_04310 [Microcoleus sp. PH2017_10_PVI_O_A]|nr:MULTISPECIES: hypothetical protein [unclassified Microcoleus]MCC3404810.1 hypothetical protein [Microcoleus sp. PH2017_10_PVI_O_A]MCC3458917.1 hypothetical protein [Microcoleus sp. PH2017_11_PCY_U_A]MCC3477118.1 hypothetical protein [Microcoleus sp. PH2017_12_PCY_D_A]MCC3526714.1 hypothetical protein [Microcoleus sp. PH2017_21_RUC_O_A]MCC3539164.1 hypothetical protein [Microcoleus sp. PH2017_22_RUC_O_B]
MIASASLVERIVQQLLVLSFYYTIGSPGCLALKVAADTNFLECEGQKP